MKRVLTVSILTVFLVLGLGKMALADVSFNLNDSGVLIHGYDPVSYFDGQPEPGNSRISVDYHGARIYFSSDENLRLFESDPDRYAPSYGGYCSYGVRMGQKFDVDPHAYHIKDDRLYLLLDRSTKVLWDKNRDHNIGIADRIWNSIRDVPAATLTASQ